MTLRLQASHPEREPSIDMNAGVLRTLKKSDIIGASCRAVCVLARIGRSAPSERSIQHRRLPAQRPGPRDCAAYRAEACSCRAPGPSMNALVQA